MILPAGRLRATLAALAPGLAVSLIATAAAQSAQTKRPVALSLPNLRAGIVRTLSVSADVTHANPRTARFFTTFFQAKSAQNVKATMHGFDPRGLIYADATTRWYNPSFAGMKAAFTRIMPKWGAGLSYPTRVVGGPDSAVVAFTDTRELFGDEIRILAAVDFKDGKVVRWIDYWDSSGWPAGLFAKVHNPPETFSARLGPADADSGTSPPAQRVARMLYSRLSAGDVAGVADLLSYDAIFEDMPMHAQLLGRAAIARYLARTISLAPFGTGARLRHVVGGSGSADGTNRGGGGFEWIGNSGAPDTLGLAALELDRTDRITRITIVYDGRTMTPGLRARLAALSIEPPG